MSITLRSKRSPQPSSTGPPVYSDSGDDFATPLRLDFNKAKSTDVAISPLKLDTPRLVITKDGSPSPTDSPERPSATSRSSVLRLESIMSRAAEDTDLSLSIPQGGDGRYDGRSVHRDSIVQRVAERLNSPNGDGKKSRSKRSRRASTSSAISQGNTIAAALAKSSVQVVAPAPVEDIVARPPLAGQTRAVSTGRSPYLIRAHDMDSDDGYGSEDDSEEAIDVEGIDHLPVTGFAVASNRRNTEFHALFPTVDEGDYLIEGMCTVIALGHWLTLHPRLWLRACKGHPCPWASLCFRKPHLLSLQPLWMGHRRRFYEGGKC